MFAVPRYIEANYDIARDGEHFVVIRGVRKGTSEMVLREGVLTD